MNNEQSDVSGLMYVLIEPKKVEPTEKEIRKALFEQAEKKGLSPARNIKTEDLRNLIEN